MAETVGGAGFLLHKYFLWKKVFVLLGTVASCLSFFVGFFLFVSEFGGGGAYIRVLLCGFLLSFFEFLVLYCVAFFSFFF